MSLGSQTYAAVQLYRVQPLVFLDRFMSLNQQIISLSRRNTNVRLLALSLNDKGKVVSECEDNLHALRDALAKYAFTGR